MSFYSSPLEIHEASATAKEQIKSYEDAKGVKALTVGKRRRPWQQMKIGECFLEKFENTTEKKLNNCVNFQRAFSGKDFVVIKWSDYKIFEVARVA